MSILTSERDIPLSLYVHIPWCVRKCPYCDFNSHEAKGVLPEDAYVQALMRDLERETELLQNRPIMSIFFGGGTPSLFSGSAIDQILNGIAKRTRLHPDVEITLEANPGTIDQVRFLDFRKAGINRLSLGIQSLQDEKLKTLGRIHDSANAKRAIQLAKECDFTNFNLDIMYGLPNQAIAEALLDIETALTFEPTHFSWYQLTIEPNTLFYHQPPLLPTDESIWDMQLAGQQFIQTKGFQQYEVSAYAIPQKDCKHNRNYWEFGDYLGIGAGAHSKMTDLKSRKIVRFAQPKHPKEYLAKGRQQPTVIPNQDVIFEFMLNALRLKHGIKTVYFTERTGLTLAHLEPTLRSAQERGLLLPFSHRLCATDLGYKFLNNLVEMFLDPQSSHKN